MALKRMDNVRIVVDDLAATIDFFRELGLDLEGQATIEGEWAGRVTGLGDQRVEIAMMRTPDGHGRLEFSRFLTPPAAWSSAGLCNGVAPRAIHSHPRKPGNTSKAFPNRRSRDPEH
jgi:catechol 2,3-dioxygenase-like lactoylglutathione lyase family enzyme